MSNTEPSVHTHSLIHPHSNPRKRAELLSQFHRGGNGGREWRGGASWRLNLWPKVAKLSLNLAPPDPKPALPIAGQKMEGDEYFFIFLIDE